MQWLKAIVLSTLSAILQIKFARALGEGERLQNLLSDFFEDLPEFPDTDGFGNGNGFGNGGNNNNNNGNNNNNDNNGNNFDFDTNIDLQEIDLKLNEKMGYILGLAGLASSVSGGGSTGPIPLGGAGAQPSASAERETQGRRAFECAGEIGNFDASKLPRFASIRNMVYGQFYDAYQTKERIDVVCAAARNRRRRRGLKEDTTGAEASKAEVNIGSSGPRPRGSRSRGPLPGGSSAGPQIPQGRRRHTRARGPSRAHRRLNALDERELKNNANYPSQQSEAYTRWANENVAEFIEGGDLTERPSPQLLVTDILDPLDVASTAYNALVIAEAAVEVVCNLVGIFEFGFDPGDFCRIVSSSIGVAAFLQYFVVAMFEADFENWEFHTFLIDSAEIEATYNGA